MCFNIALNPKCMIFFQTSNFDRSQFGSPLTYAMMMYRSSFEITKPYLLNEKHSSTLKISNLDFWTANQVEKFLKVSPVGEMLYQDG